MHTLVLGGRLENEQQFRDRGIHQPVLDKFKGGQIVDAIDGYFDLEYQSKLEIYTAELNQIFQWNRVTLSAGGRYQSGTFDTRAAMSYDLVRPPDLTSFFVGSPTNTASIDGLERFTGYGYLIVETLERLWLTGVLTYD